MEPSSGAIYNRVLKPAATTSLRILRAEALSRLPWLLHGFSARPGGVSQSYGRGALNLGYTKHDSRAAVHQNRARFLQTLGATSEGKTWPLVRLRQIHSDIIHRVDGLPPEPLPGDGLVTNVPGLVLAVLTADCLPVVLADPRRKAVGIFHAGWRGTLARILEKGVGAMRLHFGSEAADLRAAIGPGIGACCYEVGEEVRDGFHSQFPYAAELFREVRDSDTVHEKYPLLFLTARAPGHAELGQRLFLDLVAANGRQLLDAGVREGNLGVLAFCTACRTDLFFSHRGEKGVTGRQMGAVGILNL